MYKIIGGDQKEYGPATADEIRQWIAQGRLSGQSWIRLETSTEWKAVAAFPEFADALRAQTVGPASAPSWPGSAVAAGPQVFAGQGLAGSPRVAIGSCLSRSFRLLQANFGLLYGAAFIVCAINFAAALIPFLIGALFFLLLKGALYGGVYMVALKRIRGEPASVADTFSGFQNRFLHLTLAAIVSAILSALGCCCIAPGIYLFVAWTFAIPLVADRALEFWSAMELSRKVVTRVWFEMLGLLLLSFLPFIVAMICVQIAVGMSHPAITPDIMKTGQPDLKQLVDLLMQMHKEQAREGLLPSIILQAVWFLNWPFAVGALMYAYEDLFGTRRSQGA
jgi:hypothetical protein